MRWLRVVAALVPLGSGCALAAPVTLKRIEADDQAKGPVVRMFLSEPPAEPAQARGEVGPSRIVVDLPGAVLGKGARETDVGFGGLTRVRLEQSEPETARVILDLTDAAPYQLSTEGAVVTVTIEDLDKPQPAEPTPAPEAKEKPR